MSYYPVLLQVEGRRCVVIGGGAAAADKAAALAGCGARVEIIDHEPGARVEELAADGNVTLQRRRYRAADLDGAFVAICCRRERPLIDDVARDAAVAGIPLNVLDEPRHCSFIAPAVVRCGDLIVAISTSGHAPALAVRLRQQLERQLGDHHAELLAIAARLREPMARHHPDFERRRALWYRVIDSEALVLLERGERDDALELIGRLVGFPVPA